MSEARGGGVRKHNLYTHTRTRALTDTYMLSIVNCFYTMSAY